MGGSYNEMRHSYNEMRHQLQPKKTKVMLY